jgi:hypothetical protein
MKIRELQSTPLTEGFLDNLIAKVQNMAGGDGVTGVVRAMQGQNAALNRFADAIANAVRPKITERLGNQINAIKNGTADTPIGLIYKQSVAVGAGLAAKDNIEVSGTEIQSTIQNNRDAVLRMVLNGDASADDVVKQVVQAVATNAPTVKLSNDIEATIKTISLIVAGTIILLKTDKEDTDAETSLDPNLRKTFEDQGQQLLAELFEPTSQDLKALQPNQAFKDHMEALVVTIAKTVQDKYLPLATDKLTQLAQNTPPLLPAVQMKSFIGSHNPNLDATVIDTIVSKVNGLVQTMFKNWLALAAKESATGRRASHSFDLLHDWAKDALVLVDNMIVNKQQAQQKPNTTATDEPVIKIGGQTVPKTDPAYPELLAAYKKAHPTP